MKVSKYLFINETVNSNYSPISPNWEIEHWEYIGIIFSETHLEF